MVTMNNAMGSGLKKEGINIGKQRIEEIPTESGFLTFVKVKTLNQVRFGFIEDFNSHRSFSRILAFALSQSSNWAVPSTTRCRRSSRISLCQSGDSITSEVRDRSSHKASIAASFSCVVISCSGSFIDMTEVYSGALYDWFVCGGLEAMFLGRTVASLRVKVAKVGDSSQFCKSCQSENQ
jgi:hypothetical protein